MRKSGSRSGLEDRLKLWLSEHDIPYTYESIKLKYVKESCKECGCVVKTGTYTPDFQIGSLIVETKGRFLSKDRSKMKLIRNQHPDKDIRIIFQRDDKLTKKSTTTYSTWCKKVGYPFYIGEEIPEQWLKEAGVR